MKPASHALSALLLIAAAMVPTASAQDTPPGPRDAPAESPAGAPADNAVDELGPPPPLPGEAPAKPEAAAPSGDVITLKNGKVLQGVQVVRESPTKVEVQVVPGVEPISIPRKQVTSIEYDKLSAGDIKEGAPAGGGNTPAGMHKGETSMEMAQKLGKPVTDADLNTQQRDVLEVLGEFATRAEAGFEVQPQVQRLPAVERTWNTTIPAGTSFMTVLREHLPKDFPQLDAEITADRVVIKLKEGGSAL